MSVVFKKLNLKDQAEILVINSPQSFEAELAGLKDIRVKRDVKQVDKIEFALAFAITAEELNNFSQTLSENTKGDAVIWIAYPKKSSKKYSCEFNRDTGWSTIGDAGFEPVRMVAIDEDWSALRFRRVEYIKSLKRSSKMAITKAGKKRTS